MKNTIVCNNCSSENHFYSLNCKNCRAYLRKRIVNIDLWNVIWDLFGSPKEAFTNIIQAEHKNFYSVLAIMIGLKFFLISLFASNVIDMYNQATDYLLVNIIIALLYYFIIINLFSLGVTNLNKKFGIKSRFKDNIGIYIYSFIPVMFVFLIITPLAFGLFNVHYFVLNPAPWEIKPNAAYVLFGVEVLMILWSTFLSVYGTYIQTKNVPYSIVVGITFVLLFLAGAVFLPLFPF